MFYNNKFDIGNKFYDNAFNSSKLRKYSNMNYN